MYDRWKKRECDGRAMLRIRLTCAIVLLSALIVSACGESTSNARASVPYETFYSQVMSRISRNKINATRASRIYANVSLAMLMADAPRSESSAKLLRHVSNIQSVKPGTQYNVTVAAITSASSILRAIFPTDIDRSSMAEVRDIILSQQTDKVSDDEMRASIAFGRSIAAAVMTRMKSDGFENAIVDSLGANVPEAGKWIPTPPSYQPASDPGWGLMKHFFGTSNQCTLPPPVRGADEASPYEADAIEVRDVAASLTENQQSIARFWDDGRGRTGTPTGHWLNISLALNHQLKSTESVTIRSVAAVALGNADAMIDAWREKYTYRVERPVTVLQRTNPTWNSYLITPAFPEYPSGHSTLSRTSAEILSALFGNVSFDDPGFGMTQQSREQFRISKRHFKNVMTAADEASISRLYAGIHYTQGLNAGKKLGACVGKVVVSALATD